MSTHLNCLVAFVLVLSVAGYVQAQDATWTDAQGDHLWSTPGNWSEFPTLDHWAKIRNGLPGPTIAGEDAVARRVHIGYSEGGALTMEGGTLVVGTDDLLLGKNGGSGTLTMIGGTIDVARDFEVGGGNPGIVNMTGGTIAVGDDFEIPETEGNPDSPAEVHLDGGTISIGGDLHMFEYGLLDITAGTLIIDGNSVSEVQGFIDNGLITAYGGNGTLELDYDVTNEGQTTLTAVHKFHPYPGNGSIAPAGAVELSWTLPDPCTPGEPVLVDVYITDDLDRLVQFTDPASIQVVSQKNVTSVTVQTAADTVYYWAVDTYIGDPNDPILGPIFRFLAGNAPPEVDAGDDVMTWLDNGSVEVAIAGSVTDDDPTTTTWTVVSEPDDPNRPDAAIADPAALSTTVTLSAAGAYVLQLDASDGESPGQPDTMTIDVYSDGCEAAKSLPAYAPLLGDLDEDCDVDQDDLDLLLANWLACVSLGDCDLNDPDAL